MNVTRFWFLFLLVWFLPFNHVVADYLEVSRTASIKTHPTSDGEVIETVRTGVQLRLLDSGAQTNGYYHVWAHTHDRDGWIYRNRVRRIPGQMAVPVSIPQVQARVGSLHTPHCLLGCPATTSMANDLIVRGIYTLSNNGATKFADWVAYKVEAANLQGPSISRNWKQDPLLDATRTLAPDDYIDAHDTLQVDRGHQAPLAAFKGTGMAEQTNYLSNITPQKSELNQGPWVRLEDNVRQLSGRYTVYVMTGPVYEREMPRLPRTMKPHRIPSGYWKIVAVEEAGQPGGVRVTAFFFEQDTARSDNYLDHLTTVDAIEAKTGLNFFWMLKDDIEETLESERHEGWARGDFSTH